MKQIVYKFLDGSVGQGVNFGNSDNFYNVYSDNRSLIFSFRMRENWEYIKLYRYEPLCRKISALFSVTEDEAAKLISDWFGEKYGIIKVIDLKRFATQF
jgi:hypothetical protein